MATQEKEKIRSNGTAETLNSSSVKSRDKAKETNKNKKKKKKKKKTEHETNKVLRRRSNLISHAE